MDSTCSNPDWIGSCHGPALVLGSARCLWDDILACPYPGAKIACNLVPLFVPDVLHWCSMHVEIFSLGSRMREYLQDSSYMPTRHAYERTSPDVDVTWQMGLCHYSGMFATRVALALGYDPIILCGMPHDASGHFYEQPGARPYVFGPLAPLWHKIAEEHRGRVYSMSGQTRDLFGPPIGLYQFDTKDT